MALCFEYTRQVFLGNLDDRIHQYIVWVLCARSSSNWKRYGNGLQSREYFNICCFATSIDNFVFLFMAKERNKHLK